MDKKVGRQIIVPSSFRSIRFLFLLFGLLGIWLLRQDAPTVSAVTFDWSTVGWNDAAPVGPGTQSFANFAGTGVNVDVFYSGNMWDNNSVPNIYADDAPDTVTPLETALRWTNNRNDLANGSGTPGAANGPSFMEITFSQPVFLDTFVVGSLSELTNRYEWGTVTAFDESDNVVLATGFSGRTYELDDSGTYIGDVEIAGRPLIQDDGSGTYLARGTSLQPPTNVGTNCLNRACGYDRAIFVYDGTPVTRVVVEQWLTTGDTAISNRSGERGSIVFETMAFRPADSVPVDPGTAVIGNTLYHDENNNGRQDAGEIGIPNATVTITNSTGGTATTITDSDGNYLFNNLASDTYTVTVPIANFNVGAPLEGLAQTINPTLPNADKGNQTLPYQIVLGEGEENLTADFGYSQNPDNVTNNDGNGMIGDRVWQDSDGDGAQDPDELGIEGVTVNLIDPGADGILGTGDDTVLDTDITDANGNYFFPDLPTGAYGVQIDDTTLPAGYAQTGDPDHFGTTGDNDNQTTSPVIVSPGDVLLNVDFGYDPGATPLGRLGNKVWFDADASGTAEEIPLAANEYGFAGVTVALLKNETETATCDPADGTNPIIATTTTDADGNYIFEDLPLDDGDGDYDYIVWVNDTDNVLSGLTQTYDFDGVVTENCSVTALDPVNTEDLDQDFSYTPVDQDAGDGLIGDLIFFDRDGDGAQGADEAGIEGVVVTLTDETGGTETAVTDENGLYRFGDLDPTATYTVTVGADNFATGVLQGMEQTVDPDLTPDNESVVDLNTTGPIDLAQDFAYTATAAATACLGNLVWLDPNADGTYAGPDGPDAIAGNDDDEPIIADVTIDLYRDLNGNGLIDADEPRLDTAVTSNSRSENGCFTAGDFGNYIFTDIPAGDYIVDVTDENGVLTGYWQSRGTDATTDESQADPYALTVAANSDNLTADFGYYVDTASLGNRVWVDLDEDGQQDDGEPGLPNVPVTLVIEYPNGDTITTTTTTDASGIYSFDNLLADEDFNGSDPVNEPTYTISVPDTPLGYAPTTPDAGGVDDKLDSDDPTGAAAQPTQGITDMSPETNPLDEPNEASTDFGYVQDDVPTAVLGNRVWFDENSDGLQDPGEEGIPNVTVTLTDDTGATVGEERTDTDGGYLFDNLPAGTYTVTVDAATLPAGVTQTANPTLPNADFGNQTSPYSVTLGDGDENLTADFGYIWNPDDVNDDDNNGVIGDTVWFDDGDGVQQPEETGISGVTVTLIDPGPDGEFDTPDDVLTPTVTDENGRYVFPDLPPNGYIVEVDETTLPDGLTPSGDPDNYGVPGEESDNRTTTPIPLAPGDVFLNADFGYTPDAPNVCGEIGDLVWFDADSSATALPDDADEYGFGGVTVALIGDSDGDNIWDADEVIIANTTTNANGEYLFPCLPLDDGDGDADYLVFVNDTDNVLGELRQTYDEDGILTADISGTALDDTITSDLTQDFSYTPLEQMIGDGLIGDTIYFNEDGDTEQDAGELGIEGVIVRLTDEDGNVSEAVTDENGRYSFPALDPTATYTVTVAPENFAPNGVLEGMNITADPDGTPDSTHVDDLAVDGPRVQDSDFGYTTAPDQLACIGNLVWLDPNANGDYDAGEIVFGDVSVDLYRDLNGNGTVDAGEPRFATQLTSDTAANQSCFGATDEGNYLFSDIPAGDYVVHVSDVNGVLNGYWQSDGDDNLTDNSQTNPYAVTVAANAEDLTADFGYYKELAALGNRVFLDSNGNGLQDAGDAPMSGVTVVLTIEYPNGDTVQIEDVTDDNGVYTFGNLLADEDTNEDDPDPKPTYTISVETPDGFEPTVTDVDGDTRDLEDSDDPAGVPATPQQGVTDMSPVDPVTDEPVQAGIDFGFIPLTEVLAAIGNYVWFDENSDGLQDPGEAGIPNVTLTLTDDTGATVGEERTDTDGGYLFDNLPAGTYTVTVDAGTLPAGVTQTDNPVLAGQDFGNQTSPYAVTVGDGEENLTADFGYIWNPDDVNDDDNNGVIGDTVWLDDGDGVQEPEEMGLAGVTVNLIEPGPDGLFDTGDDVVTPTVTDENGRYTFPNLPAGGYIVEVDDTTLPDGLTPSGDPDNYGTLGEDTDNRTTTPIPLAPGDVFLNADFGYTPDAPTVCGEIGDLVWFDADNSADDAPNGDEYGIAGVTLGLIADSDGDSVWDGNEVIVATATTNEDGEYLFPCLLLDDGDGDADYLVTVTDSDNVLGELRQTFDADGLGSPELSATALDAANPSDLTQDFSYTPVAQLGGTGLIGDTIFSNLNGDNVQDADEPGIEGVIVQLTDEDGNVSETVTDENGRYSFPALDPTATYTVTVAPANFGPDGVLEGMNVTADPDGLPDSRTVNDLNTDGPIVLDSDFGYSSVPAQSACIGNLIWLDVNANGDFDAGETVLGDVTVDLYRDINGNGAVDAGEPRFATTTTVDTVSDQSCFGAADDGNYLFTNLPADSYVVQVTDANGYWQSDGDANLTDNSQDTPYAVTVGANADDVTADFGYYKDLAALGNRVWYDLNENGIQDDGEAGLANVVVTLTIEYPNGDTVELQDVTDGNGAYNFGNLLADEDVNDDDTGDKPIYTISAETPFGFEPTVTDAEGNSRDGEDSDDPAGVTATPQQGITDMSAADPVTDEPAQATIDFGFVPLSGLLSALGNYVWIDENSDGVQDPGEPGIPNVTVELRDGSGVLLDTRQTDTEGGYLFANLLPGTYAVVVDETTLPAGVAQTANPVRDGSDLGNQTAPYTVTLGAAVENLTADFGYIWNPDSVNDNTGDATIGDRIWLDGNGNGVQEPDEVGIGGVDVLLVAAGNDGIFGTGDDEIAATETTDATGRYAFTDVPAGAYQVRVDDENFNPGAVLEGLTAVSDPDDFGQPATDPDNVTTTPLLVAPGDVFLNADFGYLPDRCGEIGDTVWFDADASGTNAIDGGEYGIGGVTLALWADQGTIGVLDGADVIIATATTAADGTYLFSCLSLDDGDGDADYLVQVTDTDNVLAGLDQTYDFDNLTTPNLSVSALDDANASDLDQDFSYTASGHTNGDGLIGDLVYFDQDGDGTQGADEGGLEGVPVTLIFPDGSTETVLTDENGRYSFGGLDPNETYTVTIGTVGTLDGLTNFEDPDTPGAPDNQAIVPLTPGTPTNLDQDFGYGVLNPADAATIRNLVWEDNNANGIFDVTETPIGNVTVDLYRDLDGDGNLDPNEPKFATATTAAAFDPTFGTNGNYQFSGLPVGDYIVNVGDANGELFGYWHSLGTPDTDDHSQATPQAYTVAAGETVETADFGYFVQPSAIGNRVWDDQDGNGQQDGGEPGLAGATVTLRVEYPDGTVVELSTVTDGTGAYEFGNLLLDEDLQPVGPNAPTFTLTVTPPAGFVPTQTGVGDPASDSDDPTGVTAVPVKGESDTAIQLDPTSEPPYATIDFGFHVPLFIGDRVFNDLDNDGIFEPLNGEEGIGGVLLELLDTAGDPVNDLLTGLPITAVTNEQGFYQLANVPSGEFVVRVAASNFDQLGDPLYGFYSSLALSGDAPDPDVDPAVDFDDNGNNNFNPAVGGVVSQPITMQLAAEPTGEDGEDGSVPDGNSNRSVDFGFFEMLTLGNRIWNDEDRNGTFDTGEVGIGGVVFSLLDAAGDPVLDLGTGLPITAVSSPDGTYLFTNLFPGDYRVRIDASNFDTDEVLEGFISTPGSVDPDDNVDSDDNGEDVAEPRLTGITSLPITVAFDNEPDGGLDGDNNNNTNFTVDFGVVSARVAVELISFTATLGTDLGVQLDWKTAVEDNNFGFYLYRSSINDFDTATQIHFEPSAFSSGSGGGAAYSHSDAIPHDGPWYYWLVAIDNSGNEDDPVLAIAGRSFGIKIYLPLVTSDN